MSSGRLFAGLLMLLFGTVLAGASVQVQAHGERNEL